MTLLGRGKSGTIFRKNVGGMEFAVKQFRNSPIGFSEILEVILLSGNECEYLSSASFIEFDDDNESISVLMPIANGDCSIFRKSGMLLEEIEKLSSSIFNGVEYLHSLGIIHRDIKPSNILLFEDEEGLNPKLNDFGMSVHSPISFGEAYTPFYCPPEVWRDEYDSSADIWALGCTLYEIYHGEILFPIKSPNIRDSIYSRGIRKLESSNDEYDQFLSELIRIEPDERLTIEEITSIRNEEIDFDVRKNLEEMVECYSSRIITDKIRGLKPSKKDLEMVTRRELYFDEKKVIESFW